MKKEDYEKYYQSTDFYVIPTEVFKELFNELEAWKEQVKNIETIRLDQTKKVFDIIANIIKEGSCSYRHLIYDELGFYGVNYEELLSGMTITNAICDLEELREQHEEDLKRIKKLKEEIFTLREIIKKQSIPSELMEDKSFIDFYDISSYEELAFKSMDELANVSKKDLLKIIEFLQKDRRKWIDQFTKTHNESVDIQKENQELKQKYLNAVADYETTMAEKNELKKQLEKWQHHLKCSKEMLDIQGQKGNYDYDEYMLGLYNGMEYIIALFEEREPNFRSARYIEFTNSKSQQEEFINYLEEEIKLYENDIRDFMKDYKVFDKLRKWLKER